MNLLGLTLFSINAAKMLFSRYPDWRPYASFEATGEGMVLEVEVPAPPESDASSGLIISTLGGEITVAFDHFHEHYDVMMSDGIQYFEGEGALDLITSIVTEQIAVVSWWDGDSWKGSTTLNAGEKPEPHRPPFDRVRVRSWKGTLNADLRS